MARVQGMTPEGIRKLIAEAVSFIKDLNVEDLNKLLAAFEDANGIFDVRLVEAQEEVKKAGEKALEAEASARAIIEELEKYEQAQAEEAARILGEVAVAIDAANLASAKVPGLLARLELAERSVSTANAEVEKFITKQDEFLAISQEQVSKVNDLNSGFQELNQAVDESITKVDEANENLSLVSADLDAAKASLDAKMKQNELNISAAQEAADRNQNAISDLNEDLSGLSTKHEKLTSNFSAEVEKLEKADASLLTNMNTKVGDLTAATAAQSTAISAAKTQADKGVSDAAAASFALATYKTVNDPKVSQALKDADQGIEDAAAALTKANTAAGQLPAMNTAISSAAAAAKKANDALPAIRTDISNVSTRISTATGNLSSLESDVASKVAALQAMDQSQAGEISTTNSKIDNLQIGGRNLYLDSQNIHLDGTDYRAKLQLTRIPGGTRVEVFEPGIWNAYTWLQSQITDPEFFDRPGAHYTLSYDIRTGPLPEGYTVRVRFDTRTPGNAVYAQDADIARDTGEKWVRLRATMVMPDREPQRTTLLNMGPAGDTASVPTEGFWIEVRNFKLERGNKATDWTPAPEDVEASVAKAQVEAETARAEAESKANAARVAAELAAKEMADAAQADAEVEAARAALEIAQREAKAAKDAAAVDATEKADAARTAAETLAKAEAKSAKETAEANAAIDATTKANKAKTDAEAKAATLATAAKDAAATALNTYKGVNDPKVTKAQADATAAKNAAAAAKSAADQAALDATNKSNVAREAAEEYAREAAEAAQAQALETAAAEALRVAQLEAAAAKAAAATDAKAKADEAERLAKLHADTQAKSAKETAEANAALDATKKANKAKADAEANAKILSDKAQQAAVAAQSSIDNLEIGGRNLVIRTGEIPGWLDGSGNHTNTSGHFVMRDHISVTPGETLTFTKQGASYFRWNWYDAEQNYVSRKADSQNEFQWVVPSNVHSIWVSYPDGSFPQIERGNRATDWTPAPEDVSADIAKAQSDATKAIGDAKTAADKLPGMNTAISNAAAAAKKANDALPAIRTDISNVSTKIGTATGNLTALESDVASKVAALQAVDKTHAGEISTAKTQAAQGISDAAAAQSAVDNLEVGGRNYFLNSGGSGAPVTISSNHSAVYPITRGEDENGAWIQGAYSDGSGWMISSYTNPVYTSGYGRYYSPDFHSVKAPYTQSFEVMCMETVRVTLGGNAFELEPGVWTRVYRTVTNDTLVRPSGINASPIGDIPENTRLYHRKWKLERGTRATDWTPAPEDVDSGIKTALDEAKAATGALPAINTSLSDASSKANQAVAALPGLTTGISNAQKQADKGVADASNAQKQADKGVADASAIRDDIRIIDTRSVENMPIDYWRKYPMTPVKEFTRMNSVRLVDPRHTQTTYIYMDTMIPWTDASGGPLIQTAHRGSDIRNTWTRHSIGTGENATWSEWKSEFNDIQTSVSTLNTKAAELTTGLSNAATQEQYNTLNTRLWGNQGEINGINAKFQTQQKQINDNNTTFQTWQTDINSKRDKWEDGATLALQHLADFTTRQTKWNKASTDATKALSDAAKAQKSFSDNQTKWNLASTNATKALADLTTEQGKVLALQTELNTKRDRWEDGATLAINNLTDFSTRQTKWNKASTDATKALSDAAKAQKSFSDNQTKWNLASTNATKALADLTTEQGKVLALQTELNTKRDRWEDGATLAINNLTDFSTRQTKWNKASTDATNALADAGAATNQALAAHQRLIEMVYPDQLSLVPMVPGGVNTGTSAKPVYRQEPSWRQGGGVVTVNGTADMTDKLGLKYTTPTTRSTLTKNTVPVRTQDVGFSVWVYASAVNTHMIFTLADDTDTRCVQQTVIKEGVAAGTHVGYVFDTRKTGTLPVGWRKIEGVITLKAGTKAIRTETIYFNYAHAGAGTATQYFVDLKMWPIIPAQADVNEALTKAVDSHAALFEGQNKWNSVATAAIQSQATLIAKQDRWSDGVDKALAWQAQLNNSQSDINRTTKSVLANQEKWNSAQAEINNSQSVTNKAVKLVNDNQAKWNSAQAEINNAQSVTNKAVKLVNDNQAKWNTAVTNALKAHDELFVSTTKTFKAVKAVTDNQSKWNKVVSDLVTTNTAVSNANKTAIEGLTRVLGITHGTSNIVPMVPGGVRTGGTDIAPVFTPMPAWMESGGRKTVTTIPEFPSLLVAQETTKVTRRSGDYFSEVDPTIEYKYSYWIHANKTGTRFYIEILDQDGSFALASNKPDNHSSTGTYLAGNVLAAAGWTKNTGVIKFKPGVRAVRLGGIYYNHTNGVVGTQSLADIQIYPNMPSQTDVNKALTDSDAAQNTLLKKQDTWNDAASRSIATVENLWGKTAEDVGEINVITEELGEKIQQQSDDFAKNITQLFTFIPRIAYAMDGQDVPASETDGFVKITRTKSGNRTSKVAVEAVGRWVGTMIVEGDHGKSEGQDKTFMNLTPIRLKLAVNSATRIFYLNRNTSVDHIGAVKVTFLVDPGQVVVLYPKGTNFIPDRSAWTPLHTEVLSAAESTEHNLSLSVTFSGTTREDTYGVRIRVGNSVVAELKKSKIGPLFPGQNGTRVMGVQKAQVHIPAGTRIYFEAYSTGRDYPLRRVSKWNSQISYITSGRE